MARNFDLANSDLEDIPFDIPWVCNRGPASITNTGVVHFYNFLYP